MPTSASAKITPFSLIMTVTAWYDKSSLFIRCVQYFTGSPAALKPYRPNRRPKQLFPPSAGISAEIAPSCPIAASLLILMRPRPCIRNNGMACARHMRGWRMRPGKRTRVRTAPNSTVPALSQCMFIYFIPLISTRFRENVSPGEGRIAQNRFRYTPIVRLARFSPISGSKPHAVGMRLRYVWQ